MKKFLTFLALALITVTGAWAGNITSVDQAKADGYYTIVCPRSALTVSNDMTTLFSAGKAGTTFNAYDPNFLFQFKKSGDDYVLFNVGAAKYFTNEGNTVDNITDADAITLFAWGDGTAQLRWDDNHALNIGGQMEIGINDWKRADVGNRYTVAEVEPCEVVIKGNVPSTTTVSVKGTSYANGATIPLTTSFSVSDVVAPTVEGYTPVVTITGAQLVVNYQPVINLTDLAVKSVGAMTTTVNEGQWYVMTQTRDGETPVYDQGANQKLRTEESSKVADIFTVLRPANEVSNYLIRFINTGAASYAIQFANGNYWYVTATPAARNVGVIPDATNFQKFIFNEATNTGDGNKTGLAFNATEDGVTFGANLDHNNNSGGATLNFWGDGKQTSGANNIWYIYPVEIGAVSSTATVTYNYYLNNKLVDTKSSDQEVGETIAAPASLHIFTTNNYAADTKVASTGNTVRVDVIETTPFVAAESFDDIEHWYAFSVRDTKWIYNGGSGSVDTSNGSYEASDKYAWGFVGNILDGYKIYNKQGGDAVALSADDPCGLTAAGKNVTWTIPAVGQLGDASFGLTTAGKQYINEQSGKLKYWKSLDAGSSFKVVEVYLGEQEYNVIITGAPEGTKITCDGSQYANGATLTADLKETPVNAPEVDGYFEPVIEVEGLDINVTYKKYPFEIADSFANIEHWYALTVHSNQTHYLYTDEGALAFNAEGYDETDAYAWGFVGNNTDGYTIYNKATGSSVALDNNEPAAVSTDGVNIGWLVSTSSETSDKGKNGFTIYLTSNPDNNKYLNYSASKGALYHWKNRDAGSTFTPYEIDFSTKTYTVHITGAPAGTEVTYNDTKYADGGTFSAESVSSTEITPDEVEGYTANVTISGTDINVVYSVSPLFGMSDIVEKRIYTIESVDRGYFVYSPTYADGYISGSKRASYNFDATDENFHFVFLQNGGKTYLYSIGAEKLVAYASDGLVTSETVPSAGIALLASTGASKATHPTVLRIDDSHQCNMSKDQGKGILTNWNSTGDNGNMLRILPVGELTDTELAAIKEIFTQKQDFTITITGAPEGTKVTYNEEKYGNGEVISAASVSKEEITPDNVEGYKAEVTVNGTNITVAYYELIKANQLYVLSTKNRGAWVVDGEDFKSTASAGVGKDIDTADEYQQFAIYKYDGAYYLWSEGAQHFINNAGKVVGIQEASPIEWSEEAGGTYFFHFTDAADKYININGAKAIEICYWSYADEGNMMHLTPVEGFDADAVAEVIASDLTASIEVTIGATGYATIAYNETIVNKPEGLKVYYCTEGATPASLNTVEWDKDYIPGYCAYILEGTPGTYTLDCVDSDTFEFPDTDYDAVADIFYNGLLYGNFDNTDITVEDAKADYGENIYVFSKKNEVLGFYQFAGATLAAHKAFFATEEASVQGFTLDFGGQTVGVNSVISAANLKAGYDIQGRMINKIQKGINVINGKKIIK
ncbi:MAG: hypothetical protein MJZ54_06855 [Bacteroidaceae bacterium]|nr:hypothetical protein [Bacteroidaceae bacterium]